LQRASLNVPAQASAGEPAANEAFLAQTKRVVVKPLRGEQGAGITVDVQSVDGLHRAIDSARAHCPSVLLEEFVEGDDLRLIVIAGELVAAAIRRPAEIVGTGRHRIRELIDKLSRRR